MIIGFTNKAVGHLTAAIGTTDTQISVNVFEYAPVFESAGDYVFLMLRGPVNREIVRVDLAASSWGNFLTILRAQGGTSAVAWPLGSMLFATTHEDHYNEVLQRGANRIVTANPNEVETPQYAGEKIYQSGPAGYQRWWKAFNDSNLYWDLITGAIGANEAYQDVGWDFPILKPTELPFNYVWNYALSVATLTADSTQKTPWRMIHDPIRDTLIMGTWASGTGGYARVLISYDGGKTWKATRHFNPEHTQIYSMTWDSSRGNILIAGGYYDATIWASNDGGETWTEKHEFTARQVNQVVYDPINDKVIAAVASSTDLKLWTSADGGTTWLEKQEITNEIGIYHSIFDIEHETTVMVGGAGEVWASDDGGDNWALKKDFAVDPTYPQPRLDGVGYDPDLGYLYVGAANNGHIWRSKDGADTWEMVQDVNDLHDGNSFYIPNFVYDPVRKIILAGEYLEALAVMSKDGGDTWEISWYGDLADPASFAVWAMTRDPGRDRIVIGTYYNADVWTGDDPDNLLAREYTLALNKDFQTIDADFEVVGDMVYDYAHERILISVGRESTGDAVDAQIYGSDDNGATWTLKKTITAEEHVLAFTYDSTRENVFAVTRYGQLWISDDGGDTWTLNKDFGADATYPTNQQHDICYDPINDVLVAPGYGTGGAGNGTKIWISDDGGTSWSMVKDLAGETPAQTAVRGVVHDPRHDVLIVATTSAEIWKSSDAGATWTKKKSIKDDATYPSIALRCAGVDPRNGYVYVGAWGNADIWRSKDGGETWEMVFRMKDTYPISFYVISFGYDPHSQMMFAGETSTGIVIGSRDGGDTWTLIHQSTSWWIDSIFSNPGDHELMIGVYPDAQLFKGPENSAWYSVFRDTEWKTYDGTSTWGIWRLGKWESVLYSGYMQTVNLVPLTDWHLGYRPSKIRVGFDGGFPIVASVFVGLRFQHKTDPFKDHTIEINNDLQEKDIDSSWYDDGDIIKLYVSVFAASPSFKVTSIEFYGPSPF